MTPRNSNDTEALLEEGAWLRRLAGQLVHDPARAEDAAQEAWLAWARRRPAGAGRGWLGNVLRNRVRQDHRAEIRRRVHEGDASRPEATPSAEELAERLEVQRRVFDAVQALDEPYRSTLALRYLEELPPREIARRTGTPVDTVRTRLERGLARLRAELDSSSGGRERWLAALVPIASFSKAPTSVGAVTLAMGSGIKLAGSVAALALVGLFLSTRWSAPERVHTELAGREAPTLAQPELLEQGTNAPEGRGLAPVDPEVSPEGGAIPEATVETPAARPTFEGRVVDLDGRPVGGLRVDYVATTNVLTEPPASERWTTCRDDGTFTMSVWRERGRLVASGGGLATVFDGALGGVVPIEPPVLVVAPERTHAGRVVDQDGAPLAGAELELETPDAVVRRWNPGSLQGLRALSAKTTTGGDGGFALEGVGVAPESALRVRAEGYELVRLDVPPDSTDDWLIELVRVTPGESERSGVVVDADGVPVEGAWVHAGAATVTTDDGGAFRVAVKEGFEFLRAAAAGRLPAEVRLDALPVDGIVVALGREPLSISGRVLSSEGAPVEGALVWTYDGTRFGKVTEDVGDFSVLLTKDMEQMTVAGPRDGREVRSDATGRFELTGLLDATYTVQALDPSLLVHVTRDVEGGDVFDLVLPPAGPAVEVAGRVETWDGEPLAGVSVALQRPVPTRYGNEIGRSLRDERPVTDASGRFAFQAYRASELWLRLEGEVLASGVDVDLSLEHDLTDVRVRVPRTAHLRVVVEDDPDFTGSFSLLDANGEAIDLTFMIGSTTLGARAVGVESGSSGLVQADESAVTLVLQGEGEGSDTEPRRVPVELRAGEVTVVRL
ncbi:MAG: sigma-70 family RNA polymerase sigma factor [Planctomycetota bacterium]